MESISLVSTSWQIHINLSNIESCRIRWILYRKIVISQEITAGSFLSSIHFQPHFAGETITTLCLKGTVQLDSAVRILCLCRSLKNLVLWVSPSNEIGHSDRLLASMQALPLASLSLNISLVFRYCASPIISLSEVPTFCTITHLEILNGWILWGSTIGLEHLRNLTHLSLCLHTQRTKLSLVTLLLSRLPLQVLVLRTTEDLDVVQAFLKHAGLSDPWIVLIGDSHVDWDNLGFESAATF
jgi:hypothetical protein